MLDMQTALSAVQVLVSTDALPVTGVHTDGRDRSQRRTRHAEARVQVERATFDLCVPAAARGEERQEPREGGDGDSEHDGETEEEGCREEEGREDGCGQ